MPFLDAALVLAELQDRATNSSPGEDGGGDDRLLDRVDLAGSGRRDGESISTTWPSVCRTR